MKLEQTLLPNGLEVQKCVSKTEWAIEHPYIEPSAPGIKPAYQ